MASGVRTALAANAAGGGGGGAVIAVTLEEVCGGGWWSVCGRDVRLNVGWGVEERVDVGEVVGAAAVRVCGEGAGRGAGRVMNSSGVNRARFGADPAVLETSL